MAFFQVSTHGEFSAEFRVRFPGASNPVMPPTEFSGTIMTLSSGALAFSRFALWYEKPDPTSATGNLYLSSSNGRLQFASASIFDDNFYNLSIVRERSTGSLSLNVIRYENDELVYSSASYVASASAGYPPEFQINKIELGCNSTVQTLGQFWGQEARLWDCVLSPTELADHARYFESYGRDVSYNNKDLQLHWRLNDAFTTDAIGRIYITDLSPNMVVGTGSNFAPNDFISTKFLEEYGYLPGIDYGWNQEKVRVYDGATIAQDDAYQDERYVALEFNMYDALNEDIAQFLSSYDELNNVLGMPMNRWREDYEGLQQMRETYFKRLQGQLSFRTFADMLDFFDSSFVSIIDRLLPARSLFKGDEMVVESHMLERPKYQYQITPIRESFDFAGDIQVTDRGSDEYP